MGPSSVDLRTRVVAAACEEGMSGGAAVRGEFRQRDPMDGGAAQVR